MWGGSIWTWREFTTLKAQQVLPNDRVTESCNRLQRLQWSLLVVLVFVVSASLDGKKMVGLLMVVPMLGCVPNVGLAFLKVCHFSAIGTNFLWPSCRFTHCVRVCYIFRWMVKLGNMCIYKLGFGLRFLMCCLNMQMLKPENSEKKIISLRVIWNI